ncbi:hypothetical protein D3C73_1289770 [compost metagenome]
MAFLVLNLLDDLLGLADHCFGRIDDALGDLVDLLPTFACPTTKHLGDGENLFLDFRRAILKTLSGMGSHLANLLHQTGDHLHAILKEGRVRWVMDVGFHHRGVRAQLAVLQEVVLLELLEERFIHLFYDFLAVASTGVDQRGRVRHVFIKRDSAEPTPGEAVSDFFHQRFIAQIIFALEHHES